MFGNVLSTIGGAIKSGYDFLVGAAEQAGPQQTIQPTTTQTTIQRPPVWETGIPTTIEEAAPAQFPGGGGQTTQSTSPQQQAQFGPYTTTPGGTRAALPSQQLSDIQLQANDLQALIDQFAKQGAGQSTPSTALPGGTQDPSRLNQIDVQGAIDRDADPNAGQSQMTLGERLAAQERAARGESEADRILRKQLGLSISDRLPGKMGVSGFGGYGFSPAPPASGAFSGLSGVGGGPNFTGTLGSVGGLGGGTLSEDEEEGPRGTVTSRDIQAAIDQNYWSGLRTTLPPQDTLTPALQAGLTESPVSPATVGNEFAADQVSTGVQASPVTRETIGRELERIQNEALRIKGILDSGIQKEPVEDTLAQMDFLNLQADPFGMASAMDSYRRANTDLMELQRQRNEVVNGINAVTQAYEAVYEDIRQNPNLPKGLAQRRLNHLFAKEKKVLDQLNSSFSLIQLSIDDQNQMVNRAFNIYESAEQRARQQQQWQMQMLNFYVNSGAIAAFSDNDIARLGLSTGISPKGLARVRDVQIEAQGARNIDNKVVGSDLVFFDADTGKEISRIKGSTKAEEKTPSLIDLPSFDAFSSEVASVIGANLTMGGVPAPMSTTPELLGLDEAYLQKLYDEYLNASVDKSKLFTDSQQQKLFAGGKQGAPLQEQIEYLQTDSSSLVSLGGLDDIKNKAKEQAGDEG